MRAQLFPKPLWFYATLVLNYRFCFAEAALTMYHAAPTGNPHQEPAPFSANAPHIDIITLPPGDVPISHPKSTSALPPPTAVLLGDSISTPALPVNNRATHTPIVFTDLHDKGIIVKPSTPGCNPSACTITWPYVDIFYWPTGSPNSACLATMTDKPLSPTPPAMSLVSPSIYGIFAPVTVFDDCGVVQESSGGQTLSFLARELSTIPVDPASSKTPQPFNFADLPCPPPNIQKYLQPGQVYRPLLSPPSSIEQAWWTNGGKFDNCSYSNIDDPPTVVVNAQSISPP